MTPHIAKDQTPYIKKYIPKNASRFNKPNKKEYQESIDFNQNESKGKLLN